MSNGHTTQYIAPPFLVGVDEAGRGPIAGPVAVGAVALLAPRSEFSFEGVRDSKKLSEKKREYFEYRVNEYVAQGMVAYSVQFSSSEIIDSEGIVPAIKNALARALKALSILPEHAEVMLDGSLKAPKEFIRQKTIIKGDETELPITLAGIMAKTARDREMKSTATSYPPYGFEKHKGYGTKSHYQAIQEYGLCAIHRRSFIDLTKFL